MSGLLSALGGLGGIEGIGAGLGLFGHGSYGDANNYFGKQAGYLSQMGADASQFGTLGQQALGEFNAYDPQYRSAVDGYADYLRTDPFTDQYSTAALNRATQGLDTAKTQAENGLTANLARRGFDLSGGQNSQLAGGISNIEGGTAAAYANAQNQLAYNKIQQNQARQQALVNLMGGVSSGYYGRGASALGEQASLDGSLASAYGGLGNESLQRTDAYNGGINSGIGGLMGLLGGGAGRSAYYASMGGYGGGNPGYTPSFAPSGDMSGYGGASGYGLGYGAGGFMPPGSYGLSTLGLTPNY